MSGYSPDELSEAFSAAAELADGARAEFLGTLRLKNAVLADEVASLLGYHETGGLGGHGEASKRQGAPGTADTYTSGGAASLLDKDIALLLGIDPDDANDGEGDDSSGEVPLAPGTLLRADGGGGGGGLDELEIADGGGVGWTYRVVRELGRGGMGVVYEAEQALPARRVALKLLKGGSGFRSTLRSTGSGGSGSPSRIGSSRAARRLAVEAEALGALHHPGVAQVYAAGTVRVVSGDELGASAGAASERPVEGAPAQGAWLFIAMELINGPSLSAWAKVPGRDVRSKVAMLASICDAVEHAHQRGVVHRDLKPSNVLIDGGHSGVMAGGASGTPLRPPVEPQAKVLDFGVARLTGANRVAPPGATLTAGRGQIVGTLRYMSPEQARGGGGAGGDGAVSVDGRSDIYALGAMLYELLTGRLPIEIDDASIAGALERISTVAPLRPGVAEIASQSGLGHRRARDLVTVTLKALEKQPRDRYQHAIDLGADLRRVLMDEPISARPPTVGEQLFRLVRRNRVAAAGVLAGLGLLLVGAGVATWQAVRATRALERANDEAAVSRSALAFMQRMVQAGTPSETRGQDVTVREMLQSAARDIKNAPDDRATAAACRMLAAALRESGSPAEAEPLARRALSIERRVSGEESRDTIDGALEVVHLASMLGREVEARAEARRLYLLCQSVYGPDDELTLRSAMTLHFTLGESGPAEREEGERLVRDVVARMEKQVPANDRRLLVVKNDLTALLLNQGRGAEALVIAQEVCDLRTASLGLDHPDTIVSMSNLTAALSSNKRLDEALAVNTRAVGVARSVLGPDHPSTHYVMFNRAQLLAQTGKLAEAEVDAKAVWEGRIRRLGADTRLTLNTQGLYAALLLAQGRLSEAESVIASLVEKSERSLGLSDDDTHQTYTLLWDLAEAKKDKAGMESAAARLKGTRYDPAKLLPPPSTPPEK